MQFRPVCCLLFLCSAVVSAQQIRTGIYAGHPVTYRVINGQALYQGDIVLGDPAELETGKSAAREASGVLTNTWPDGIVPYTIDADMPNQRQVLDAIQHWTDNTPVRFTARGGERNYVRFYRSTAHTGTCSSSVGMTNRGEQRITLEDGCGTGSIIHEMGHAVGLWHEQSRLDRNRYVTVLYENADKQYAYNFDQELTNEQDLGGYDFGSIMHYTATSFTTNALPTLETVPPGIPIGQRLGLSAGDIAAVRKLYSAPFDGVTVTTVPANLQVVVDGAVYPSPAKFNWEVGSRHTIGVNAVQGVGSTRYLFARWSDEGESIHSVTVSEDQAVYSAAYSRQYRVSLGGNTGKGSISIDAPSADGFYTDRSFIRVTAVPQPGWSFVEWSGNAYGSVNPRVFLLRSSTTLAANFSSLPVASIATNPPGRTVLVDGGLFTAPQNFPWVAGTAHTIEATDEAADTVRHTWKQWSDGGDRVHSITAGPEAATITADFLTQNQLRLIASPSSGGVITTSPTSADNFYDSASTVELTASPGRGYVLLGWSNDASGSSNPLNLPMAEPRIVTANFYPASRMPAITLVSAASFAGGRVAPGELVTLFGSNLGPATLVNGTLESGRLAPLVSGTRVLFDEVPAPLIYVSAGQTSAVVPYSVAGRTVANVVVEYQGIRSAPVSVSVGPSAPAFFTMKSIGSGPAAALNQDASLNSDGNPASCGSVVVFYATGEGLTDIDVPDGAITSAPFAHPKLPVSLRIGGRTAKLLYAGAAPGMVAGVLQVNAEVPEGIMPGPGVPVYLVVGDNISPSGVTIAVK